MVLDDAQILVGGAGDGLCGVRVEFDRGGGDTPRWLLHISPVYFF
jgi:hypothetical protein